MKQFLTEFKSFIARGNVLDMAVGVIIGTAFSAIINALVTNVMMPIIGIIIGGVDFSGLSIKVGSAEIMYGAFIQAVINFLIIAFVLFCLLKVINLAHKKPEEPAKAPEIPADIKLLTEIRDLLQK